MKTLYPFPVFVSAYSVDGAYLYPEFLRQHKASPISAFHGSYLSNLVLSKNRVCVFLCQEFTRLVAKNMNRMQRISAIGGYLYIVYGIIKRIPVKMIDAFSSCHWAEKCLSDNSMNGNSAWNSIDADPSRMVSGFGFIKILEQSSAHARFISTKVSKGTYVIVRFDAVCGFPFFHVYSSKLI